MNKKSAILLLLSHSFVLFFGFALGIYTLPILIAPSAPTMNEIKTSSENALYTAQFVKELDGSDALHWGEGEVSLSDKYVTFTGKLAPGPDYKLYLVPQFVETESEFEQVKHSALLLGDVKTFENFIVNIDGKADLNNYNTVLVWCETFGEFITSAQFK